MAELPKDMIFHYYSEDGITIKLNATELIKCQDCRWREQEQPGMVYCPNVMGNWVEDDWFCADGEKGEEDENI